MAEQIEFGKFKIIRCSGRECIPWGGMAICDTCGERKLNEDGYYIAVLNKWLCKDCFEEWKGYAHWYPEDAQIENRNFKTYSKLLGI